MALILQDSQFIDSLGGSFLGRLILHPKGGAKRL